MSNGPSPPRHDDPVLKDMSSSDALPSSRHELVDLPVPPKAVLASSDPLNRPQSGLPLRPTTLNSGGDDEKAAYAYKSASMSSTGGSSSMTPISSIDLEKGRIRDLKAKKQREVGHGRNAPLEEKTGHRSQHASRNRPRAIYTQRVAYLEDDDAEDARQLQEEKAVKILIFLSGPCVILSFLNAIWALISLVIVTMAQPVRICARRPSFGQQLGGLLGPALNLQLKSIYTPLPPHADEDTSYHSGMLLIVQLLSPLLSLGMMLAGWVAAIFWFSSMVVGDPCGTDKRDDGRETVLSLRNWWERWLVRSMRED